jgi:glycosyltransferase involved in cell wall biosynthesis
MPRAGRCARIGELRIALDATCSIGGHLSGVGVYSRELLHGLARLEPGVEWIWLYRPQHWRQILFGVSPPRIRRGFLWERRAPDCDLFHGLGQRLPASFDSLPRRIRTAVTFHDLFVMTREYSSPEFRARFTAQAREAARRADAIIAVSRFTAGQVEELLGVEPARIHVVHHGVRPLELPAGVAREPMILSVGALQTRKNTLALVRAFERLPRGWRLVLAGSKGYGYEATIAPAIEASPRRADIELPGWIDDAALARLYARASVFAFPSLDEGFGIPVLEAMAAGIPVLASNASSLPEVCGDAAVLVAPRSEEEIAAGLARLIDQESLRTQLIERGRDRAGEFTWEKCARETWEVFSSLQSRPRS